MLDSTDLEELRQAVDEARERWMRANSRVSETELNSFADVVVATLAEHTYRELAEQYRLERIRARLGNSAK
jgi:predicted translin family RNA/ssDNA-binding protein